MRVYISIYIYIYNAYLQHVNANKQILLISIIENDMWVHVFVCNLLHRVLRCHELNQVV